MRCRSRSHAVSAGVEGRSRASGRGDRDATPEDEGGTRSARARRARGARGADPCAHGGGRERAALVLNTPAARLIASGEERLLLLEEVEALLASDALVVDACRHVVRQARTVISLATRPVLFALARVLAEAWPGDVPRDIADCARIRIEVRR